MGAHADALVHLGRATIGFTERICADIPADRFASLIRNESGPVHANHPAFAVGHLALYPPALLEGLGKDPAHAACPPGYAELFAAGVDCREDQEGSIYPPKDEILGVFTKGHSALLDAIGSLDDDALTAQNPREGQLREMFPTLGGALALMLGSHAMLHLGQISTWRRCAGFGSAM